MKKYILRSFIKIDKIEDKIAEEKVNNIIYILRDYMIEVDFDPVVQQLAVPKK